jgi:sterol desaturase/sphingolipid hydroxylase (fatty acid hydroxylase superfamily)
MSDLLFNVLLLGGLAMLIGLELRSPTFRAGAFEWSARAARNWSFLAGAIGSAWILRIISDEMGRHVKPLVTWDRYALANVVLCFLVADLIGWVLHWVKHTNGWLWRFHFPHHREKHFDVWMVAHTHALEVIVAGTFMSAILILLGFTPTSLSIYFLFYGLVNTYQHSAFDYSLGPLDKIIIGPAYHRLHHAVGAHTNFGDTLTIWDLVFRTVTWPESHRAPDVEIGLGECSEPYGFAAEMMYFARSRADGNPGTPLEAEEPACTP